MLNNKRQRTESNNINKDEKHTILPIERYKDKILEKISKNKVTIISGETGCGKSTQIPQYLILKYPESKILMTQPRIIAVKSLYNRIKKELGKKIYYQNNNFNNNRYNNNNYNNNYNPSNNYDENIIGYQVAKEKKINCNTQIFIKTTGIFLEECIHNELSKYNYIIIDEVHERDFLIDLVLFMIKRLLEKKDNIKVILMSATINIDTFFKYFNKYGNYEDLIFEVKENIYQVKEYYIEDFEINLKKYNLKGISFIENKNEPYFSEELFEYVKFIIIDIYNQTSEINGILIFLPGINEIRKLENYLNEEFERYQNEKLDLTIKFPFIKDIKNNLEILILHSELKEVQHFYN